MREARPVREFLSGAMIGGSRAGDDLQVSRPRRGGRVFRKLLLELQQPLDRAGEREQMLVVAHRHDRLAFDREHLEPALLEQLSQRRRRERRQLELLALVGGEPLRARAADELFQRVEVPALDEVIERGELVVGRGDDDAAGFA